jgi:hypothetical protein
MTDTPDSQPSAEAASAQTTSAQAASAQAASAQGDGGDHTETETHGWTIDVPDHPTRQDSPEYVAARRQMNEIASQATGLMYGPGPFQDHHGGALWLKDAQGWFMVRNCAGIEWSAQFCLDGNVRVLTADLRWVPIKEVTEGQTLLGFDEESLPGLWRRWQPAEVLATRIIERPCYDLMFDDGTKIRASAEHRWLVNRGTATAPRGYHNTAVWVTTEDLRVARGWTPEQDDELRRLFQADAPTQRLPSGWAGRSTACIAEHPGLGCGRGTGIAVRVMSCRVRLWPPLSVDSGVLLACSSWLTCGTTTPHGAAATWPRPLMVRAG